MLASGELKFFISGEGRLGGDCGDSGDFSCGPEGSVAWRLPSPEKKWEPLLDFPGRV